jgi:hypothetical protein
MGIGRSVRVGLADDAGGGLNAHGEIMQQGGRLCLCSWDVDVTAVVIRAGAELRKSPEVMLAADRQDTLHRRQAPDVEVKHGAARRTVLRDGYDGERPWHGAPSRVRLNAAEPPVQGLADHFG